jgi:succinate dehydrogenase / fumarate reductase iron-sulfur subunit
MGAPNSLPVRTLRLKVWRQEAESGAQGQLRDYVVEVPPEGMVVDVLFALQVQVDSSFAFRVSCRAGMCGSCAVRVDGRERLACQTPLSLIGAQVRIEPLRNLPVMKDLVVDLDPFFAKYGAIHPEFRPRPLSERARVTAAERSLIERSINCISCGACYSSCDIVGLNKQFIGPAALARAWALVGDRRDADPDARWTVAAGENGAWRCHNLGNCTVVCPKGVAPLLAIQALRRRATWKS